VRESRLVRGGGGWTSKRRVERGGLGSRDKGVGVGVGFRGWGGREDPR
jgi:hypothetical protein